MALKEKLELKWDNFHHTISSSLQVTPDFYHVKSQNSHLILTWKIHNFRKIVFFLHTFLIEFSFLTSLLNKKSARCAIQTKPIQTARCAIQTKPIQTG